MAAGLPPVTREQLRPESPVRPPREGPGPALGQGHVGHVGPDLEDSAHPRPREGVRAETSGAWGSNGAPSPVPAGAGERDACFSNVQGSRAGV